MRITRRNFRRTAHRGLVIRDRTLIKAKLRSVQRAYAAVHTLHVCVCVCPPAGVAREGIEFPENAAYIPGRQAVAVSPAGYSRELG